MPTSTTKQHAEMAASRVQSQQEQEMHPCADLVAYLKDYAREKPEMAALWCFGIGFVVGWKIKPW